MCSGFSNWFKSLSGTVPTAPFDPTQIFRYRTVKDQFTTVLKSGSGGRAPFTWRLLNLMATLRKLGRLFTIKTRLEAFLATYAIAVGAIERGIHYMQNYPGNGGNLLAAACLGVPFIAGAKLLDSVRPAPAGTAIAGQAVSATCRPASAQS